jgi:hypothetical protein
VALLLEGAVDYAGLFPPAALSMEEAVTNYAAYRRSSERWALGRLILPASRLSELAGTLEAMIAQGLVVDGWRLGATLGSAVEAELRGADLLNQKELGARVDAVEAKVATPRMVAQVAAYVPADWACFGEVPLDDQRDPVLNELKSAGIAAKIRMGGVTPEAFPSPDQVAGFLAGVVARDLPFKATAGLHHPIRGAYRLTYEPGSRSAEMYGYLNLMVASLLAQDGAPHSTIVTALLETDGHSIRGDSDGIEWRGHHFARPAVLRLRQRFCQGFGSCSFREPLDELRPALAV